MLLAVWHYDREKLSSHLKSVPPCELLVDDSLHGRKVWLIKEELFVVVVGIQIIQNILLYSFGIVINFVLVII